MTDPSMVNSSQSKTVPRVHGTGICVPEDSSGREHGTKSPPVGLSQHHGNIIWFLHFMDSKPQGVKFSSSQAHFGATCKAVCLFHYVAFSGKRTFVGQEFLTS